jgi:hypothetical protein
MEHEEIAAIDQEDVAEAEIQEPTVDQDVMVDKKNHHWNEEFTAGY